MNKGIFAAYEYYWDYTFLSCLYEFFLLHLEILDKFNLLQNLLLRTQKNLFVQQTPDLLEKLAESLIYNFLCKHIF